MFTVIMKAFNNYTSTVAYHPLVPLHGLFGAFCLWTILKQMKEEQNFGRPPFGQPQMIPLLYQHHLCRDRCINIYQKEIFQFAREIVYSFVNSHTSKNRQTQLSRGFTFANLKFGNILLFEAKTIGYFEIVIRWTYVP